MMYFSSSLAIESNRNTPVESADLPSTELIAELTPSQMLAGVVGAVRGVDTMAEETSEGVLPSAEEDGALPDEGLEDLEMGDEFLLALSMGSALNAGDYAQMAKLTGNKALGGVLKAGLTPAVGSFVHSTWFALQYPTWGALLQWGPLAAWFGPPAFLVNAAVGGALFAAMIPLKRITDGMKSKWDRSNESALMKAALPVAYATGAADGRFTVEELRFLKDLARRVPHYSGIDIEDELKATLDADSPEEHALESVRALVDHTVKSWSVGSESLLRFGVKMAHADGEFDSAEREFLQTVGEELGYEADEASDKIHDIDRSYRRGQQLAEAALRAMYYVGSELPGEEPLQVLDTFLIAQIPAERDRRRLARELPETAREDVCFSREEILAGEPHYEQTSLLKKVNPLADSDPYKADFEFIIRSATDYFVTLESVCGEAYEGSKFQIRQSLCRMAAGYGMTGSEVGSLIEEVKETKEEAEEHQEASEQATCPECETEREFDLSHKRWLGRNEYECKTCSLKVMCCQMPKCSKVVRVGDIHHEQLCEDHWPV